MANILLRAFWQIIKYHHVKIFSEIRLGDGLTGYKYFFLKRNILIAIIGFISSRIKENAFDIFLI